MSNYISNRVYRNLISSIVNSTPDRRVGCQPADLLSYVKEVFEFDDKTHRVIVEEESANKPEYELYVTLIEGRNIVNVRCSHACPYCILTVTRKGVSSGLQVPSQPQRKLSDSFLGYPAGLFGKKESAGGDVTPRLSDAFDMQMQHSSCLLMQDSETPRWNEEFHFYVGTDRKQNLVIHVLRSECIGNNSLISGLRCRSISASGTGSMPNMQHARKEPTAVGTFKNVVSALTKTYTQSCNCKASQELTGTCSILLKELPVNRLCEKLLPIVKRKSGLTEFVTFSNSAGLIRLKLRLASKANSCVSDLPEADHVITLDDVASVVRRFHLHNAMRQHQKYDCACTYSGDLPDCSDAILEQFLISNNFTRLTRHVVNLSVLLEWHKLAVNMAINDLAYQVALDRIRCSCAETPLPGNEFDSPSMDFCPLTAKTPCPSYHIEYLYDRTIQFLNYYLDSLARDRIRFFPPGPEHDLATFSRKLNEFCLELCQMQLWMWGKTKQPFFHLRFLLTKMIESDARTWFRTEREDLSVLLDLNTMQYVSKLANSLDFLDEAYRSYAKALRAFFRTFEIDYGEVVVPIVDSEISEMAIQLFRVFTLSQRHVYYDREMLLNASRNTSRLYFETGRMYELMRETKRNIPLQLASYQTWFIDCLDMWLHTTKVTSYDMVMKSAQKDPDLEKAAANVNFTASTVDVLAICKRVCDEFVNLELTDPNTLLLATIKVIDITCDNAIGFSKHLYQIVLAKHKHSAGKVQIVRAANSICHVGQYLSERLPEFLRCKELFRLLDSAFGKESQEYEQARGTLTRLASSTREVIDGLAADLIEMIVTQLLPDIEKHCVPIMASFEICSWSIRRYLLPLQKSKHTSNDGSVDSLLHYLEKCLCALRGALQAPLFELSLNRIWTVTMDCLRRNTPVGQAPGCYEQLYSHLKMLQQFFDLPSYDQVPNEWFDRYMAHVELQARSTPDLILGHYAALSNLEFSSTLYDTMTYQGRLNVKLGYQRVSGEKINIVVKIMEAVEQPDWDSESPASSNPSVRVGLCPPVYFVRMIDRVPVKVVSRSLVPVSENGTIEFVISESYSYGCALGFLITIADCLTYSELASMAFVHLGRIPQMSWKESVDDMATIALPLLLLTSAEQLGPAYEVLKQRRHWDPIASEFVWNWEEILQKRVCPLDDEKEHRAKGGGLQDRVAFIISRGTHTIKANVKRLSLSRI